MLKLKKKSIPVSWLIALVVGFVAAQVVSPRWQGSESPEVRSLLRHLPVHATATQGHDNFVIATGMVGDGLEGIYFLDFLTGDLKATVINERAGGFSAFFDYNISEDFNLAQVRNPKYLMVTGLARDVATTGPGGQMADSVLYVVEATTGQLVAYGLPWRRSQHTAGKVQRGAFIPLARTDLRTQFVRDQ